MAESISGYLVKLRRLLVVFLPASEVDAIVRETGSHLQETSAALRELGRSEAEALEMFGSVSEVARAHVQGPEPRVHGMSSRAWACLLAAVGGVFWMLGFSTMSGYFDNYGESTWLTISLLVGGSCTLMVIRHCARRRRTYALPLLVVAAGLMLTQLIVLPIWMMTDGSDRSRGLSRLHMSRDARQIRENLAMLDRLQRFEEQAQRDFAQARTATDLPPQYQDGVKAGQSLGIDVSIKTINTSFVNDLLGRWGDAYLVPRQFMDTMVDGRIWALDWEPDFTKAKSRWAEFDVQAKLDRQRAGMYRLQGVLDRARSGQIYFYNPTLALQVIATNAAFGVVVLFLGCLGAGFGLVSRRIRPSKPRLGKA